MIDETPPPGGARAPRATRGPGIHQVLVSPLLGGAGVVALDVASFARGRGRESVIWVPGAGPASALAAARGLTWRRYQLPSPDAGALAHGLACLGMAPGLFRTTRPIVHVHTPTAYRLLLPALRLARARTIVHVHLDPDPAEMRWALRRPPDLVIACARYIKAKLESFAVSPMPLRVVAIPNAVDTRKYSPGDRTAARAAVGATPGRPLVVMLANLSPHKGQETTIRAVAHLRDHGVDVDCWLAGHEREGGTYTARLQQLARALHVQDRVRLIGFVGDTAALLRAADLLFLPSTLEGLPLTILEAQASRVAVVASPIPGVREVIEDGVTGYLVDPADAAGYAEVARRLLQDAAACDAVTARAHHAVLAGHSWEAYARATWAAYEEVGAGGRQASIS